MEKYYFECQNCKQTYPYGNVTVCDKCGGIVTIKYTEDYLRRADAVKDQQEEKSIWNYAYALPEIHKENIVSFREGGTPLVKSREIARILHMNQLYLKDETKNPTGSFKDRAISVCVSAAKEMGCNGIVAASSGNGGAATSAYGVKGNFPTIVFVPESTPQGKIAQAITYGGKIIKVKGNFSKSFQAAKQLAKEREYMNVSTTFMNPWGIEGYKTLSYEMFDSLGKVPDVVIVPVGDGPILYGVYKGFMELKKMGKADRIPKLVCAQAKGCSPISNAWIEGRKVKACENPHTIASAISDPLEGYEEDGNLTVRTIHKTNGYACALSDKEIIEAGRLLACQEGIYVEPSSAVAIAALIQLKNKEIIGENDVCVCVLTGHGLKDSNAYISDSSELPVIHTIDEIPEEYLV